MVKNILSLQKTQNFRATSKEAWNSSSPTFIKWMGMSTTTTGPAVSAKFCQIDSTMSNFLQEHDMFGKVTFYILESLE